EVEHAAIEVKKIGRAVYLAPVAKPCFTAIETVGVLDDHQRQQAAAERTVELVINDDRWSRFFQSCGLFRHRSLIGPNALAAAHLLFNHAANIVLRRLRLLATTAFFLLRRRAALGGNYLDFVDYDWHLKLL